MTGGMSVNPAQVMELASRLRDGSNKIQAELDDLDAKVKELIGAWDGAAQTAYHTAQTDWKSKVGELNTLLATIGTKTTSISEGYTSTDQRNAGRFPV